MTIPPDLIAQLEKAHGELGLDVPFDAIVAHATERVTIVLDTDAPAQLSGSRYGGAPALPSLAAWPRSEGGFLNFFMQIALSEVPAVPGVPLPESGLLQVFIGDDNFHEGGFEHRLEIVEGPFEAVEPPPDEEMAAEHYCGLDEVAIRFVRGVHVAEFPEEIPEADDFIELNRLCAGAPTNQIVGQIGGWPRRPEALEDAWIHKAYGEEYVYDSSWRTQHMADIREGANLWRHLLRIDSEFEHVGAYILSDCGCMTVLIPRADLDPLRLGGTWVCRDPAE